MRLHTLILLPLILLALGCSDQVARKELLRIQKENTSLSERVEEQRVYLSQMTNQLSAILVRLHALENPPKPTKKNEISGTAFYRMKNGTSIRLAGNDVFLLNTNGLDQRLAKDMLESQVVNDMAVKLDVEKFIYGDQGKTTLPSVSALVRRVSQNLKEVGNRTTVGRTSCDADGKFRFDKPPPGKYYLYASFETGRAVGYWWVAFTVKEGTGDINLDLSNTNIDRAYDFTE